MKTSSFLFSVALSFACAQNASAQGSLTPPPGPPGPVMKSLDQVEARIPLVDGQPGVTVAGTGEITITASGSYYLTGNLTCTGSTSCINVGSHNVTLDLNGYTISRTTGTESGTAGIYITGTPGQKVMIRNGFIVGGGTSAGFAAAIDTADAYNGSVHVENVHCSNVRNGITLNFDEGRNSVRDCSVEFSGDLGIKAELVAGCVVRDAATYGILGNVVTACTVRQSGSGIGIAGKANVAKEDLVADACYVNTYTGRGIIGTTISKCMVRTYDAVAINAELVTACTVYRSLSGTALQAGTAVGCSVLNGSTTIDNKYNMP